EDGIRDATVTGVQTCALPIYRIDRDDREREDADEARDRRRNEEGCHDERLRGLQTELPRREGAFRVVDSIRLQIVQIIQGVPAQIGRASCRGRVDCAVGCVWV